MLDNTQGTTLEKARKDSLTESLSQTQKLHNQTHLNSFEDHDHEHHCSHEKPDLNGEVRYWKLCDIRELYNMPFMELVYKAATIHRIHFNPNKIQLSTLVSLKTGGCPENCAYCPQSAHYNTGVQKTDLMPLEEVLEKAKIAKSRGATRFCMGGAWRSPPKKDREKLVKIIEEVKKLGLETCGTFGKLTDEDVEEFDKAGLDYYNHNIDTSESFYGSIISTRTQADRFSTIDKVHQSNIKVCCGGIVGMNETREVRISFLASLANMEPQPQSVPINSLVRVKGTPLEDLDKIDWTEFVRTIAVARIICPKSHVRIAAGRHEMDEATQAMCFMAGANSIFMGGKLLITPNREEDLDTILLNKLNMQTEELQETHQYTQQDISRH